MSDNRWSVAEAKSRFSAVIRSTELEPQVIENRGREVAVLVNIETWREMHEQRAGPRWPERLARFLVLSEEIGRAQDIELDAPARQSRPSPWVDDEWA